MDTSDSKIKFNNVGLCEYCNNFDRMLNQIGKIQLRMKIIF